METPPRLINASRSKQDHHATGIMDLIVVCLMSFDPKDLAPRRCWMERVQQAAKADRRVNRAEIPSHRRATNGGRPATTAVGARGVPEQELQESHSKSKTSNLPAGILLRSGRKPAIKKAKAEGVAVEKLPHAAKIENRRLDELMPNPLQAAYYPELNDYELAQLAEDIAHNGLKEKIEILPDNVILSGHQRHRALLRLGRAEQEQQVVVRYDLAAQGERAVEEAFLRANELRRHSDPLSRARVTLRLIELEKNRDPGEVTSEEDSLARDRVGQLLGMSGRNLARYLNLLKAPLAIQKAFQASELGLNAAAQVGALPDEEKDRIADRIIQGEPAKTVVEEVLKARRSPRTVDHKHPWRKLQQALREAVRGLQGQEAAIATSLAAEDLAIVQQGHALLGKLLGLAGQGQGNGGHRVQRRPAKRVTDEID
jgi:hypothetical protein